MMAIDVHHKDNLSAPFSNIIGADDDDKVADGVGDGVAVSDGEGVSIVLGAVTSGTMIVLFGRGVASPKLPALLELPALPVSLSDAS
jgi:hypothetical protein